MPTLAIEHGAVLACGADAYLSHHSAAAVWGIRPAQARGVDLDVTVVGRDAGRRWPGINARRTVALDLKDRRRREGIAIVSPVRAMLDIAPDLAERDVERAFDEALVQGLISFPDVLAILGRYPGRRGSAVLALLADPSRQTTVTQS